MGDKMITLNRDVQMRGSQMGEKLMAMNDGIRNMEACKETAKHKH